MNEFKGEHVKVLRESSLGDCTNGGASAKHDRLLVIGDNVDQRWDENDLSKIFVLVKRDLHDGPYYHIEPLNKPKNMVGPMFGGNYCTPDGSLRSITKYPIPIHDRFETQSQYDTLSR